MNIFLAKKDFESFSKHDIQLLAKNMNIAATEYNDKLWLIALKLHNKNMRAEMISDLPSDMHFEILKNMDMDTLIATCQTSKTMLNVCKKPYFWSQWSNDVSSELRIAIQKGYALVVDGLIHSASQEEKNNALIQAIKKAPVNIIQIILEAGADPNYHYKGKGLPKQRIPLFDAIGRDDFGDVVKLLVKYGADINGTNIVNNIYKVNNISIPDMSVLFALLYIADRSLKSEKDNCELLLKLGADPNFVSRYDGTTVLMLARDDTIDILMEYGAAKTLTIGDKHGGTTSLIYAASKGRSHVVKVLLDNGANQIINVQDNYSYTALLRTSKLDILKMLLEAGANPNIRDNEGENILLVLLLYSVHKESDLYDMVKLVLDYGVDIKVNDINGDSAIDIINSERFKNDHSEETITKIKNLFNL